MNREPRKIEGRVRQPVMAVTGYVGIYDGFEACVAAVPPSFPRHLKVRMAKWLVHPTQTYGPLTLLNSPVERGWLLPAGIGSVGVRKEAQLGCLKCRAELPHPGLWIPRDPAGKGTWGIRVFRKVPPKLRSQTFVALCCPDCKAVPK